MSKLVQIDSSGKKNTGRMVLTSIDKFFVVGLLAGLIGSAWIGVHLWLGLQGRVPMPLRYVSLKELHSLIQFYLFLGFFITGFCVHALPHLLKVPSPLKSWIVPLFLSPILGVFLVWWGVDGLFPRALIAFPYLAFFIAISSMMKNAEPSIRIVMGVPLLLGIASLGIGAFTNLSNSFYGMCLFWFGIAPIIFATGQQFLRAFLSGHALSTLAALSFLSLYVLSALFATLWGVYAIPLAWTAFVTASVGALIVYFSLSDAKHVFSRETLSTPLGLAFVCGFLWAFVGLLTLFKGAGYSDMALHQWALGWAVTLIIGTSSQIVESLSKRQVLPKSVLWSLILLWQLVPIGRGLSGFIGLGPNAAWVVGGITIFVLLTWGIALSRCVLILTRRQLELHKASVELQKGKVSNAQQ